MAEALGCSPVTVYDWRRKGYLAPEQIQAVWQKASEIGIELTLLQVVQASRQERKKRSADPINTDETLERQAAADAVTDSSSEKSSSRSTGEAAA